MRKRQREEEIAEQLALAYFVVKSYDCSLGLPDHVEVVGQAFGRDRLRTLQEELADQKESTGPVR
jgi:hypothetical protein